MTTHSTDPTLARIVLEVERQVTEHPDRRNPVRPGDNPKTGVTYCLNTTYNRHLFEDTSGWEGAPVQRCIMGNAIVESGVTTDEVLGAKDQSDSGIQGTIAQTLATLVSDGIVPGTRENLDLSEEGHRHLSTLTAVQNQADSGDTWGRAVESARDSFDKAVAWAKTVVGVEV